MLKRLKGAFPVVYARFGEDSKRSLAISGAQVLALFMATVLTGAITHPVWGGDSHNLLVMPRGLWGIFDGFGAFGWFVMVAVLWAVFYAACSVSVLALAHWFPALRELQPIRLSNDDGTTPGANGTDADCGGPDSGAGCGGGGDGGGD